MSPNRDRVMIFDTTLRDGEQSPGCTMNQRDKLMVAELLEALKVDIIGDGFAVAAPGDFESVLAIAGQVREAGLPLHHRTPIEGRRHARQENHGPPSAQVQTTPQQVQSSSGRGQSGHQRTKRPAH